MVWAWFLICGLDIPATPKTLRPLENHMGLVRAIKDREWQSDRYFNLVRTSLSSIVVQPDPKFNDVVQCHT